MSHGPKTCTDPLVPITLTLRERILQDIDRERGNENRSAWIRNAIEAQLKKTPEAPGVSTSTV